MSALAGLRVVQEMVFCSGWSAEFVQDGPSFADTVVDVTCELRSAFGGKPTGRVYGMPREKCHLCKGTGAFSNEASPWLACGACAGRKALHQLIEVVDVLGVELLVPSFDVNGVPVVASSKAPPISEATGPRCLDRAVSGWLAASTLFAAHRWTGTVVDATAWFPLSCGRFALCRHEVCIAWPFSWLQCSGASVALSTCAAELAKDVRLAMSAVSANHKGMHPGVSNGWRTRLAAMRFWDTEVSRLDIAGGRVKVDLSEAVRWCLLKKINLRQ